MEIKRSVTLDKEELVAIAQTMLILEGLENLVTLHQRLIFSDGSEVDSDTISECHDLLINLYEQQYSPLAIEKE